jgi:hypothetical protein
MLCGTLPFDMLAAALPIGSGTAVVFPLGNTSVPPGVPAGQLGRLLAPIRMGARMKPWELKVSSSLFAADGASAVGFGVPVRFPVAERGGTPTSAGGFVPPLVDVPP